MLISIFSGIAVWLVAQSALEPRAARMLGILAAVIMLWLTEAVPLAIPGIVGTAVAVTAGIVPMKEAFNPLADKIIILFIGSFLIAHAIEKHGLSRRIAYSVLSLPAIGNSPRLVFWAVSAVNFGISAWVSNTATCAMMLPIAMSIIARVRAGAGKDATRDFGFALAFTCAFSASIGGLMTPVGTPPNLIGIGQLERITGAKVTFFDWFAAVSPPAIVIWLLGCAWLDRQIAKECRTLKLDPSFAREQLDALGPMGRNEKWTLAMLALTILGWIVPPAIQALELVGEGASSMLDRLFAEPFVPVFFAFPLFMIGGQKKGEPALTADDFAVLDWNTVFLYGGGLCIGVLIEKSGLSGVISAAFSRLPLDSTVLILAAAVVLAVVMSEFASNTASANIIAPIIAAAAGAFSVPTGTLMLAATAACTLGFLLPVSTPLNAMVYATGEVPLKRMFRTGLVMDIIGVVVLVLWFRWRL